MIILQAENISKRYQMGEVSVQALNNVDLVVSAGDFLAIMGPSGSGKSTLLHLLGALDTPSEGEVRLGQRPLASMGDEDLSLVRRRQVGFIFQSYNLLPTLTAWENIGLPLLIDGEPLERHRQRIEDLLNLVGLAERGDHKPEQLSGGEQQRVAIARALVNNPQIVLADEPTGNLDSRSGAAILSLLRKVCDELGATILMVTHDPRAAATADRVIFLKDGRLLREVSSGQGSTTVQAIVDVMAELEL
jgi:putative ABC transport system ATP-binding protein